MTHELLVWLTMSALAVSAAILAILAIRPLWLRHLGAASVLWLWLLVPAAWLASSLPAPLEIRSQTTGVHAPETTVSVSPQASQAISMPSAQGMPDSAPAHALLALWLAGALLAALWLCGRQYSFRRKLGPLLRGRDGSLRSAFDDAGPVLIGVLRPRIVLPVDFERRYTPLQQRLVLAHERVHRNRGDLQVNLLFCLLRCLYWFNPLVHIAAQRLRFDQELACDAAVLRDHPSARRSYADALLNTALANAAPPLACPWQPVHSLKRRIAMLKLPAQRRSARTLCRLLAVSLAVCLGSIAWAAQPPRAISSERVVSVAVPAPAAPRPSAPKPRPAHERVDAPAPASAPPTGDTPRHAPPMPAEAAPSAPSAAPAVAPSRPVAHAAEAETIRPPAAVPGEPSRIDSMPAAADGCTDCEPAAQQSEAPLPEAIDTADTALFEPPQLIEDRDLYFPVSFLRSKKPLRQGEVVIRAVIDKRGYVKRTSVERSEVDKIVDRAAEESVRRWRFEPARVDGEPVVAEVLVPIRFPPTTAALSDAGIERPSVPSPHRWINGRR